MGASEGFTRGEGMRMRGNSPIHFAAGLGHVNQVYEALLEVDLRSEMEITPLFFAVHRGYLEPIRELLEGGTDVNARDWGGRCAAS